ncbi:hypothetical protein ACTNBM_01400 [Lachnospiraceae bacterium HCP1S3_C3]
MKLKYYLRGLGTGIFVTALIMTIAFSVSNTKSRAESELAKNTVKPSTEETSEETTGEPATKKETTPAETTTKEKVTEEKTTEKVTKETTTEETEKIQVTTIDGQEPSVVLDIYSGMSSNKVAARLQELGVIDDKNEFNDYIYQKHMEEKIKVGQFTINYGASYEEILDAITG